MKGNIGDVFVTEYGEECVVLRPYNVDICNPCSKKRNNELDNHRCRFCTKLIGCTKRVVGYDMNPHEFHGSIKHGFEPWEPIKGSIILSDIMEVLDA